MAKKKNTQIAASQEENAQAQHIFAQYHQIATHLHKSQNEQQAETALTEINTQPEGAQIALLKDLSKEHHVDAADVVLALHELSPLKSVRKEARRALIQLEGARIYPQWKPALDRSPAISLPQAMNPLYPHSISEKDIEIIGAENDDSIDLHGLKPQNVVTNFIDFWVYGNYGTAYDLLSNDSSLREGLSRHEWIERRQTWANETAPDALEPGFIFEPEQPKSKIWLPDLWSVNYSATHKEFVAGWSIELAETPLNDTLPELPQATMIYEETKRHWFWTSYTLVQENDEWRIQSMTDEGTKAQNLSIQELQEKLQDADSQMQKFVKKHPPKEFAQLEDEDTLNHFGLLVMGFMQTACCTDILIKKSPLDQSLYIEAAGRMLSIYQYERCLAYLTLLIQRFPEQRGLYLRRIATVQLKLSNKYFDEADDERSERYQDLAEKSLRESLAIENSFEAHISLTEQLIEKQQFDEAEDHLLQASELVTDAEQEAHVELHLGEIATERGQLKEALSHYQRVVDLQPDSAEAWFDVGEAHEALEQFAEAEISYKRAIELEPDAIGYYYTLSDLYAHNDHPSQAIEVIEQGIAANPDSATLHIYLAAIYMERGDDQQAEIHVNQATQLDPESDLTAAYSQLLKAKKPKPGYAPYKLNKPLKQKKKRR
jgi:tetratricopeptide (TPR) repeat protein